MPAGVRGDDPPPGPFLQRTASTGPLRSRAPGPKGRAPGDGLQAGQRPVTSQGGGGAGTAGPAREEEGSQPSHSTHEWRKRAPGTKHQAASRKDRLPSPVPRGNPSDATRLCIVLYAETYRVGRLSRLSRCSTSLVVGAGDRRPRTEDQTAAVVSVLSTSRQVPDAPFEFSKSRALPLPLKESPRPITVGRARAPRPEGGSEVRPWLQRYYNVTLRYDSNADRYGVSSCFFWGGRFGKNLADTGWAARWRARSP